MTSGENPGPRASPETAGPFDQASGDKSKAGPRAGDRERDAADQVSSDANVKTAFESPYAPKSFLPKAAFAPLAPPTLDLPKGGGAIRGIGETFRTNPATGTAGLDIPLPLTKAPHGPTPQLSLSYDSGQGNGTFGLGWSLSVPRISRRTDNHIPEYRDSEDSDAFLLSGAEELVPLLVRDPVDGWVRPPPDTSSEPGYAIERYRPRTEGLFAWIERRTSTADGSVHWRTISRDHVVSTFGSTDASRISDPAEPRRVFAWLLDRTEDLYGHVVTYLYKQEDLDNVDMGVPAEAHRRGATLANRYLKSVRYGNTSPGDESSYAFEIVFDYGEHDADVPTPVETSRWLSRLDAFSSYRAGFELRTYRLCHRVLMFHHIPELSEDARLVRSLYIGYDENRSVTKLTSATSKGYIWQSTTSSYTSQSMPSLLLTYSEPVFTRKQTSLDKRDLQPEFPQHAMGKEAQWVDLEGEGIPGALVRRSGATYYQRNLGQGRLAVPRCLPLTPNLSSAREAQLTDVAGAGTMALVAWTEGVAGFHERFGDGWGPFTAFASQPSVNWNDPNMRLVDINGDGFADILISRGDHFIWYPSLGKAGFGAPQRVALNRNERAEPRVVFNDAKMSIFLADMTGDGLTDIVRVRYSGVSYWPNLGYGRFGAEVRMSRCPELDRPEWFNPKQLRFADLDGTGTADLLYFKSDYLRIYRNQAGNSFDEPLLHPMPLDAHRTVALIDFYGKGMTSIVWSPTVGDARPPLCLAEPFGPDKPHLLAKIDNQMGKTVALSYTPSTEFSLADRRAGKPWATKLPFPVQVVTRVETSDAVSRTRLVTTYAYHHGFYDTTEREFRGFGRVDQVDTETFASETGIGLFQAGPVADSNDEVPQPPVLTRTWFHTGAWFERRSLEAAYATEWWSGDTGAAVYPAMACALDPYAAAEQTPEEIREATRALRGSMLRQEIYGLDGSPAERTPFAVVAQSYTTRLLQPRQSAPGKGRDPLHGVFQSVPRETRSFTYERVADDPRLVQELALQIDAFGAVTRAVRIAYARRAVSSDLPEQGALLITVSQAAIANLSDGAANYRIGVTTNATTYELKGVAPAGALFTSAELDTAFNGASALSYEDVPGAGPSKRVIERVRTQYYAGPSAAQPLPFDTIDAYALPYQTYRLDLSDPLLTSVFGAGTVTAAILADGGYVSLPVEPGYWAPSGVSSLDAGSFYLPTAATDPFGNTTSIAYDARHLAVASVKDAKSNTVVATTDYRVLAPIELLDPNWNRSHVVFDELGRVTALVLMGKSTETLGDTLAEPTVSYTYELDRFLNSGKPNRVHVLARETHVSDGGSTRLQESYVYSDGSGRVAMTKARVEPGDAPIRDANGNLVLDGAGGLAQAHADPRWIGSGKTVLNNKGNSVKQYQPFFSSTSDYETEVELVKQGVTPLWTYDALGRVSRVDLPNGSYRRSTWDAWTLTAFDENDTVGEGGNLWRAARQPSATPILTAAEQRAANITDAHANTFTVTHLDTLGRPFLVVEDNGGGDTFPTRSLMDIEGQVLSVVDALIRTCQTNRFSIGGQLLQSTNIDSGTRLRLATVRGEPLRRWDPDAPSRSFRYAYDELRRPTHLYVTLGTAPEKLLERRYYGEAIQDARASNLLGRLFALFDGSGLVESTLFDFKGNLLTSTRRFATVYDDIVDWSAIATQADPIAAEASSSAALVNETFTMRATYDALNRVTSSTSPDNQIDPTSVTVPIYNQTGLLQSVGVQIRGSPTATPFVARIDYDALGRRTQISYANGTTTAYAYERDTLRLATLVTKRGSTQLQNLLYTYDPVGNVVAIADAALQDLLFTHTVEDPSTLYVYDPTYRLTNAAGRESAGNAPPPQTSDVAASLSVPDANTGATARYTETYGYDAVANITQVTHVMLGNSTGSWTRLYDYSDGSTNRLRSTGSPADPTAPYGNRIAYDGRGNATSMSIPFLSVIESSPFDQMMHANLGGGGDAYYVYASGRTRVRKVIDRGGGLIQERLYLGGYELYRQYQGGTRNFERQALHVMDGAKRIALVETKTTDGSFVASPISRTRYQLSNHLDSVAIETDEKGAVFSYEEYFPYGGTAYRSGENGVDVSAKRYRYCGAERDDETGFYCMGARYYCPWLGRWTTADPLGLQAGINLYLYCRAGPITLSDPSGLSETTDNLLSLGAEVLAAPIVGSAGKAAAAGQKAQAAGDNLNALARSRALAGQNPYMDPARPDPVADRMAANRYLHEHTVVDDPRPTATADPRSHAEIHAAIFASEMAEFRKSHPTGYDMMVGDVQTVAQAASPTFNVPTVAIAASDASRALGAKNSEAIGQTAELIANVAMFVGATRGPIAPSAEEATSPVLEGEVAQRAPLAPRAPEGLSGSGPAPGVIEVSPNVKSTRVFQGYKPSGGSGIEFVFDPTTNRFAVGRAPGIASPHQNLARAIDADPTQVVGGMFGRGPAGEIVTNENSGHYGTQWTPEKAAQLKELLETMTGLPHFHVPW